ncbi:MAG: hypothetical protein ABIK47_00445 [candidate division WOR-3 bacterium]
MEANDSAVKRYAKKAGKSLPKDLQRVLKPLMIAHYADARRYQQIVDNATLTVINSMNINPLYRLHYLNFGRQVWAKFRRFGAKTLNNELDRVRSFWQEKGLEPEVLLAIQQRVLSALRAG